ncbi:hypothetical protein BC477_18790 [Clavibacter michiganensis subsp. michiganensis]|uniref:Uncharacterized protein n=1 Tax=Clavibacter michiganensis subsp. michiganensis TaxID=33013 RepID=A0A251XGG9_CLAMM|nr:hypothetical protein BC477_18790 [Clavibacter michiganensis subsp. michiganensis]OUE01531.1 hypothetical protein CMMCAS07_14575 [Clavibacter michiganensis subsp. michiganensis]
MRDAGRPMWVRTAAFDDVAAARSTTILISAAYGDYRMDESRGTTSVLPTVIMEPVDGNGPVIMAVHPVSPIPSRWTTGAPTSRGSASAATRAT